MTKQKRNYTSIKLEFFQSDFDEVKSFITHKGIRYNAEWSRRTKGRGKEKMEYKNKILEKALENNAKKEAENLTVPISDLMKGKKAMLQLLLFQVGKYVKASKDDNFELDEGKIEKIMKMIKTELGEPSNITQNQNLNTEVNNELTDDEKEALQILLLGKSKKQ